MKNTFKTMAAMVLAGVALTGCTDQVSFGSAFIDKAPGGSTNLDSIFSNADYINQYLTSLYARQYYGLPFNSNTGLNHQSPYVGKLDALTDLYQMHWASQTVWNSYYTGTLTAKNTPLISFSSDGVWEMVHQACVIKENIDNYGVLDQKKRDYIVAQATALQAFAYSILLPHYGGLPIVNQTITGATEEIGPRKTFEETVDFIVSLCDEAAPYLYWAYNGNDSESSSLQTGRWTKAGVMALKAQVLWLAASPLFNSAEPYYGGGTDAETNHLVWYGNYDASRWTRALQAFEDFWTENRANGEYYHLLQPEVKNCDGYRIAYRQGYVMDDSPENIHWTKVSGTYGSQGTYCWFNWNWPEDGVRRLRHAPSLEYVEMFPWSDGKPFDHDTDFTYQETYTVEADNSQTDVYTCLKGSGSNANDNLFYSYTAVRGGFRKDATRDPRLYENALVSGEPWSLNWTSMSGTSSGNIVETWVGGQDGATCVKNLDGTVSEQLTSFCPTGFGALKYVYNKTDYHRNYNMHWNVLTIPDMILMYAECLAECNRNADAITQVDLIRSRVGLKSVNSSYNSSKNLLTDKDNLIEEILRERACELGMTNARYIDMVRRKRTDWMTKQLHGMATYRMIKNAQNQWVRRNAPYFGDDKNGGMSEPSRFEYEFFELFQGKRVLWGQDPNSQTVKKWLMMPFPQDEINKGYGLIQNPGW